MPFTATQKCFLASVSERWDPGTHVAKLELPAVLGSCRRPQKVQGYFPSFPAFPTHMHVCAYTRTYKHRDALRGRSSGLRVVWQQERAQQAARRQGSCRAALQRNGISLGEGGREINDPCGELQDFP